ncbi:hypothetical protein L6164_028303 [Bauhinia variegata]|uniref:Uncharacterized protein n=1 Tax=Bauhinia variegata TaxID=167791 RepID=A0ACB9LY50_BAUVA|nr:hypothetical protein L6164_028303 [Bauhinia variegata]
MKYPRVVRISVTDSDCTDSSSDEEAHDTFTRQHRVRKFVSEITIDSCSGKNGPVSRSKLRKSVRTVNRGGVSVNGRHFKFSSGKKYPGVRQKFYNNAAIQLRGADALSNFIKPRARCSISPESKSDVNLSYTSGEVNNLFSQSLSEEAESVTTIYDKNTTESREFLNESRVPENFSEFESIFPTDVFDLQCSLPDIFDNTTGDSVPETIFTDVCSDIFLISSDNFGFSSWHRDEYFQDIGDLFASDPLVPL